MFLVCQRLSHCLWIFFWLNVHEALSIFVLNFLDMFNFTFDTMELCLEIHWLFKGNLGILFAWLPVSLILTVRCFFFFIVFYYQ